MPFAPCMKVTQKLKTVLVRQIQIQLQSKAPECHFAPRDDDIRGGPPTHTKESAPPPPLALDLGKSC